MEALIVGAQLVAEERERLMDEMIERKLRDSEAASRDVIARSCQSYGKGHSRRKGGHRGRTVCERELLGERTDNEAPPERKAEEGLAGFVTTRQGATCSSFSVRMMRLKVRP